MQPYGYHWRTVDRPAALVRAGYECQRCAIPDRPAGLRSSLDGAHLDGDPRNGADDNVAILCRRCHRAHDLPSWTAAFRAWLETERDRRIAEKDAARPILAFLERTA